MEVLTINVARAPEVVAIGNARENIASEIAFDYSPWVKRFGEGTCYLHVQRPQDANPYEAVLEEDETSGRVIWRPTNADTDFTGRGRAQFVFMSGEVKARSVTFFITSAGSLDATGDPPEPWETWMDALEDLADETTLNAREARSAANAAAESAEAADNSAAAALQSENNAKDSEDAAKTSEETAAAQAQNAGSAAATAALAATDAQRYAANAAASASSAENSASAADNSRAAAASAAQTAGQAASNANSYASTAAAKATEASGSAATAAQKASDASASATAAASSATSATSAASNAASSATSASTSATNAGNAQTAAEAAKTAAEAAKTAAETAQGKAEDAQEAAETAAQSIEDSAAQIDENTAGLVELRSAINAKAGILRDTVSGSVASFVPDSTVPNLLGLSVALEPIQDLHGYDSPWPAGGGKNKIVYPYYHVSGTTTNGVTFTVDADGTVIANGTATANAEFYVALNMVCNYPAGTYTLSGLPSGASSTTFCYNSYAGSGNSGSNLWDFRAVSDRTVAVESEIKKFTLAIRIISGYTANNLVFKPMFESGSSASPYSPYSNLCPISGRESVEVDATGKNLFEATEYKGVYNETTVGTSLKVGTASESEFNQNGLTVNVTAAWNGVLLATPVINAGTYYVHAGAFASTGRVSVYKTDEDLNIIEWQYNSIASAINMAVTVSDGERIAVFAGANAVGSITFPEMQCEYNTAFSAYALPNIVHISIQLGDTVYGGTLDVTAGTLTVDRAMVDLGTLTWVYLTSGSGLAPFFFANVPVKLIKYQGNFGTVVYNILCSMYKTTNRNSANFIDGAICADGNVGNQQVTQIQVKDSRYTDATSFKAAVTGQQLCYELATPIVIDLDPVQIATIANQTNNVWADAGDVDVTYAADLKTYIDQKIAAAVAALS